MLSQIVLGASLDGPWSPSPSPAPHGLAVMSKLQDGWECFVDEVTLRNHSYLEARCRIYGYSSPLRETCLETESPESRNTCDSQTGPYFQCPWNNLNENCKDKQYPHFHCLNSVEWLGLVTCRNWRSFNLNNRHDLKIVTINTQLEEDERLEPFIGFELSVARWILHLRNGFVEDAMPKS